MLKKIGIIFGCLFGAFLLAALLVPFLVDVDKFRPEIVKAVNANINGEFRLGKLSLSVLGGLKVKAESLFLKGPRDENAVLETNSAYLEIPFTSLLAFSPRVIVVIDGPKLEVVQRANGKLNLDDLIKPAAKPAIPAEGAEAEAAAAEAAAPAKAEAKSAGEAPAIPAFVAAASLGLEINQAKVTYINQATKQRVVIDGLEVLLKNLGLMQTIDARVFLPLNIKAPDLEIGGSLTLNSKVTPIMKDGQVRSATGVVELDAGKLMINAAKGAFNKSNSIPARVLVEFDGTETDFRLKNLEMRFHELVLLAKGVITLKPEVLVKLEMNSQPLDLGSLATLVPMLKEYGLAGKLNLELGVEGPVAKIAAKGKLGVSGGKVAYPSMLKAPLSYQLNSAFTENSFDLAGLNLTAPGSDLGLKGKVRGFNAPQFDFQLEGKTLDLDQLVNWAALSAKPKQAQAFEIISSAYAAKSPAAPAVKNPLAELAKNPMILGAGGVFTAKLGKLIAQGTPITDIGLKATLRSLVFNIESATLKTFEGVLNAKANADLKTTGLNYSTSGTIKGLSAKNALTTYMPKFKDTLEGKMNANWALNGAAYPEATRMRQIAGTVAVNAEKGRLRTVDMQDSIKEIMAKVPFLAGRAAPKFDEGFESMRAEMKLSGGVIDVNPMEVVGGPKGLTIKGRSRIQESLEQETFVDVFDPNRLLPQEISNGKDVALALRVTGPISAPKTDYGYTVTRLAKNAVKNEAQKQLGKGLQRILGGGGDSGAAPAAGGGSAPQDKVKEALKKIKLF